MSDEVPYFERQHHTTRDPIINYMVTYLYLGGAVTIKGKEYLVIGYPSLDNLDKCNFKIRCIEEDDSREWYVPIQKLKELFLKAQLSINGFDIHDERLRRYRLN